MHGFITFLCNDPKSRRRWSWCRLWGYGALWLIGTEIICENQTWRFPRNSERFSWIWPKLHRRIFSANSIFLLKKLRDLRKRGIFAAQKGLIIKRDSLAIFAKGSKSLYPQIICEILYWSYLTEIEPITYCSISQTSGFAYENNIHLRKLFRKGSSAMAYRRLSSKSNKRR